MTKQPQPPHATFDRYYQHHKSEGLPTENVSRPSLYYVVYQSLNPWDSMKSRHTAENDSII